MARVTIYKNSILATLLSFLSYALMLGGLISAFGGEIIGGILIFGVGLGVAALASILNEVATHRKWMRKLKKEGILDRAAQDANLAVQIFQTNPTKLTLRSIRKINPTAADYIDRNLVSKK